MDGLGKSTDSPAAAALFTGITESVERGSDHRVGGYQPYFLHKDGLPASYSDADVVVFIEIWFSLGLLVFCIYALRPIWFLQGSLKHGDFLLLCWIYGFFSLSGDVLVVRKG